MLLNRARWERTRSRGWRPFVLRTAFAYVVPAGLFLVVLQLWSVWRLHEFFSWPTSALWPLTWQSLLVGLIASVVVGLGVGALGWYIAESVYLRRAPSRQNVLLGLMLLVVLLSFAPVVLPWMESGVDRYIQRQAESAYGRVRVYTDLTEEVRLAARAPSLVFDRRQEQKALELLTMASQFRSDFDWNYGNAIHYANILLGRLALARAQVGISTLYLLRAADIDGSPQLSDYGPDMTLAQELLWCGQSSVVLQYFERCARFWRNAEKNRLQEWSDAVCLGSAPQFGTRSGFNPTRRPR